MITKKIMKVAQFGWEADMLLALPHKPQGVQVITPVLNPITVRGYQFDIGFMAWQGGGGVFDTGGGWTEVLFSAWFDGPVPPNDFGVTTLKDLSPTAQNLHGGGPVTSNALCFSILKGFVGGGQNAVDKSLINMGLDLTIPAGSSLWMTAIQAGTGPLDFEVQGCLFYE
jgi:hypothetical protein